MYRIKKAPPKWGQNLAVLSADGVAEDVGGVDHREGQLGRGGIVGVDGHAHAVDVDLRLDVEAVCVVNAASTVGNGVDVQLHSCTFLGPQQHVAEQTVGKAVLVGGEIHGHSAGARGIASLDR